MSEIFNLTSICRCCHKDGQFKSLHSPYVSDGSLDVYANIMFETFGIAIKYPPCEASFSICDECISQLKQAFCFKKQVLSCELKFAEYCKNELAGVVKVETDDEDEVPDDTAETIDNDKYLTDVKRKKREDFDNGEAHEPLKGKVKLEPIPEEMVKKEKCKNNVKSVVKRTRSIRVRRKTQKDVDGVKLGASEPKSSENSLLCRKCNIRFDNNDDFQTHKRKMHRSHGVYANKYRCEICEESLSLRNEIQFVKHMEETHNVDKPFKCTYCEKSYTSLSSLKCHINSHEEKDFYQCDFCGKKFYKKICIVRHLKLHYGTTKKHICDLCGWSFNDTTNLRKHIAGVHENLRPFSCTFCDKTFKYKKQCTEHLRTHTGELFTCELCGSGFVSKFNLGRHTQEHHLDENRKSYEKKNRGEKVYQCMICLKQLSNKSCYLRHLRLHRGHFPHKCTLCPRDFTCKFMLKRHIESHYGIKKFECDVCKKKFTSKASLERHKQTFHIAERKMFYCEKCELNVRSLELHKCSGSKKKLKCHICDMCYSSDIALKRHVRLKHTELHACKLCPKKYLAEKRLSKHMKIKHQGPIL